MVNGYMCLCTDGYSGGFCEKGLVIQHVFSLKHGITRILLIYVYFLALLSSLAHTLCSFLSPMSTHVFFRKRQYSPFNVEWSTRKLPGTILTSLVS